MTSKKTKKTVTKSTNGKFDDVDRRRELGRLNYMKESVLFSLSRMQEEVRKYIDRFGEEPNI